jgi:hypothetical protein
MESPILAKATDAEGQGAADVLFFACGECEFTMRDRRTQRRSAADRFAGHAWFQPSSDLVVDDCWDHDLLAPEAVLRAISKNPEGFRIV